MHCTGYSETARCLRRDPRVPACTASGRPFPDAKGMFWALVSCRNIDHPPAAGLCRAPSTATIYIQVSDFAAHSQVSDIVVLLVDVAAKQS